MSIDDKKVGPAFGQSADRQVPVEATFLAAAPCNQALPEEYVRAQDYNEDAWRAAMDVFPSMKSR